MAENFPPQEAGLRQGRKESSWRAREVHGKEWFNFAKAVDERVEVNCIKASSDPHPGSLWCEW